LKKPGRICNGAGPLKHQNDLLYLLNDTQIKPVKKGAPEETGSTTKKERTARKTSRGETKSDQLFYREGGVPARELLKGDETVHYDKGNDRKVQANQTK